MPKTQTTERVGTLVHTGLRTAQYLDKQASSITQRFGVHAGRATLVRAMCEACEAMNLPLAELGPTSFHIRAELIEIIRRGHQSQSVTGGICGRS